MIGSVRPLALYAAPMTVMNAVGECVSRPVFGRSTPRGETAPPRTVIFGDTAFRASYVFTRSDSYAGAATSLPSRPNCGSQYRFRFGSFPITKSRTYGSARATFAAYVAKSDWSWSESGVVRLPWFVTERTTW